MIELIDAARSIGREVEYRPHEGSAERGVITGISAAGWIFVQYGTDTHAKATHPGDLYLKPQQGIGGGSDATRLGLVGEGSLDWGQGSPSDPPCTYCGIVGGHNGNCPVVS